MTTVELRRITVRHHGETVVDDVSLRIDSGAQIAVCGLPDSGIHELARALVGLDEISEGAVLFDDEDVSGWSPKRRDVCLVMDDHPLLRGKTVRANLAYAPRLRGGVDPTELDETIEDAVRSLALTEYIDERTRRLLPHQRQRVAIGRALVRGASLSVFDEAFSSQPGRIRAQIRGIVADWQREATATSVYVTTDPSEAISLGDAVVVMHQGAIVQVGPPAVVYDEPADVFVAVFAGDMNLLPGEIGKDKITTPWFSVPIDDALRSRLGDDEDVLVGFRPQHLLMAGSAAADAITSPITIDAEITDVDWQGSSQALLFEIDAEDWHEDLTELEDLYETDLFEDTVLAWVEPSPRREPGQRAALVLDPAKLRFFDLGSGEILPA